MKVLAPQTDAFDRAIRPVMDLLFPENAQVILDYRGDPAVHERVEELGRKANEGELSDDEAAEYDGYILANDFVAMLRRQARRSLNGSTE